MSVRPLLELRQQQQLTLTPQLRQSLHLLQLPAHELEQAVAQALLDNPLLERVPGPEGAGDEGSEPVREYDIDARDAVGADGEMGGGDERESWLSEGVSSSGANRDPHEFSGPPEAPVEITLRDHLLSQLRLTRASPRDQALVALLVDELDGSGYLETTLEAVLEGLPAELEVSIDELQAALRLLQSLDPAGIGARSLAECLLLQLDPLGGSPPGGDAGRRGALPPAVLSCTQAIVRDHLALLAAGRLGRLREVLGCDEATLQAAHALLLKLEPRPARPWGGEKVSYITPEVLVRRHGGRWQARLNQAALPRVRVDALYEQMLARAPASEAMRGQLQQAQGLVRSLHQRYETILRVAQAIVQRQQAYFDQGESALRPLRLKDIAEMLEVHESTVSRATRYKYAQTPWGVVELKRFFSASLEGGDGDATSAMAVRALIVDLIRQEDRAKPLSDSQLAERLAAQGIQVARRTVAKYREAAGIEVGALRRVR